MEKPCNRFRYLLRNQRREELIYELQKDFPGRTRYNIYEIQYFLRIQGFHLQETEISKMIQKLYCRQDEYLSLNEALGLYGRLSVDQQVEADFRKIFQFFSAGEEQITAQQLKNGLLRLGETLKDKEVNQIFVDLDLNFNGYINFETFLEAMVRQ